VEVDWNQEKAAKLLGITRKMLTNRIKKYHLEKRKSKVSAVKAFL
jgi:DNA-binding NtrC family response regulator